MLSNDLQGLQGQNDEKWWNITAAEGGGGCYNVCVQRYSLHHMGNIHEKYNRNIELNSEL